MPWTERVLTRGRQTIIQVIDRNGQEVPLFTMTKFLTYMTAKIAAVPSKQ